MTTALGTYLRDHLGGAEIAVQLLEAMRDHHDDPEYREFASSLLPDIQQDYQTLRSIAEKVGTGPSRLKEAGGWILEKLARLKVGHAGSADFELFESLELLVLGVHGKLCLWKALEAASAGDSRLREYNFTHLAIRAQEQYDKVERERLKLGRKVLIS